MSQFVGELLGTALLLLLGNGVVANVVLKQTKGEGSGWIVVTLGWGLSVFLAVAVAANLSGAHINPAVTLALAVSGQFDWSLVPLYWTAQFVGAALGATSVWLLYHPHFALTEDKGSKLAVFCTSPSTPGALTNLTAETIATFVLVLAVLRMATPNVGLGSLDAIPVALVVLVIGLSLGGTTGYAINPARDLAPRLMHRLLPVAGKGGSDWSYAWIPVLGPMLGALAAAFLHASL